MSFWPAPVTQKHNQEIHCPSFDGDFGKLWKMSSTLALKNFGNLTLYTNVLGKSILVDIFQLNFTEIIDITSELNLYNNFSNIFALSKLITYSKIKEPFIHIDYDAFILSPLPQGLLESEVFAQCPEFWQRDWAGLECHYPIKDMLNYSGYLPPNWLAAYIEENHYPYNMGIFGGYNTDRINKYAQQSLDTVLNPFNEKLAHIKSCLSIMLEQYPLGIWFDKVSTLFKTSRHAKDPRYIHLYSHYKSLDHNKRWVHDFIRKNYYQWHYDLAYKQEYDPTLREFCRYKGKIK